MDRRVFALLLALGSVSENGVARATPPASSAVPAAPASGPQRAAALKKKGDAAMDGLRYDEAIDDYTAAYAASPDPALLYNRGRVHQARGEWPEALSDLEGYARDASPNLRARVPKLDELLAEARAHVGTLKLESNVSGARVLVRDKQVGTTPLADALALTAGPARVEVLLDGYLDWRKDIDLKGGAVTMLDAVLSANASTGIVRVRSATRGARIVFDDHAGGGSPAEAQLSPGPHRVVVRADGCDDAETRVVVVAGETRELDVEPERRPAVTSRWWFWTGVGVVIAGAAVTAVALTTEKTAGTGDHFAPGQVSGP